MSEFSQVAKNMLITKLDEIRERLEVGKTKEDAVYVGDSDVDLATACNVGIPCISVLWGFRDRDFLIENGATRLIDYPLQLLQYLEK